MLSQVFRPFVRACIAHRQSYIMARATRSSAKPPTEDAKTYPYPKAVPKKSKTSRAENEVEPEAEEDPSVEADPGSEPEPKSGSKSKVKPKPTKQANSSTKGVKTYPYPKASPKKPKAPKTKSQPEPQTETEDSTPGPQSNSTKEAKPKSGKDSHLYTDDNPTTTLHGTGFKDAATARHTIELVQKRSLLYQFQTINTMYNRTKHHPHSSKNKDMQAAMAIFREWLDETYAAAKDAQMDFKPLLKRDVVEKYLPRIRDAGIDTKWAELYIALPKGKRLANILMDDEKPGEADLAKVRQDALEELVTETENETLPGKNDKVLWDGYDVNVSLWHLNSIAYAWSPAKQSFLLKKLEQESFM